MFPLILRYGIVAGLIVALPMLFQMLVLGGMSESLLLGYTIMIVALTAVFLGVKQYRDRKLGGVIRFLPALGVGLAISTIACLMYVVAWEISLAATHFDFGRWYANAMVEAAKARHASPAEIQQAAADADAFAKMYANPLLRMPMTFIEMFPVGLLVSLVTAALLRNSRFMPARAS
jgi:uncharacterized protein DUF4199